MTSRTGESRLVHIATIALFFGLSVVLALPLFSKAPWMIFIQDDFLYYLKVAQNIAHGHGSTFNGLVQTNGYQPLWLILLVALSWCTQAPRAILGFLAVLNLVAAVTTFVLARRLLRASGARPLLVFCLSAYITIYSVTLFFYGMEATLAVPIILAVADLLLDLQWLTTSPRNTFFFGLLLSAMVLARIDTLILGALLLGGILLSPSLRRLLRVDLATGLFVGLLPLASYFALNRAIFHTWLPISGMAKELKLSHAPSMEPWRVFFHPLAAGYAVLFCIALCLTVLLRRRLGTIERVVYTAILLFPFVYYLILSYVSDWTLWGWYMYPLRTAMCISFVVLCSWQSGRRLLEEPITLGVLLLVVFGSFYSLRWTRQQTDIYAASLDIQKFAETHHGTYAMGDRAGRVAYLIADPMVQVEGLVMDRDYLDLIRRQTPLRDALARYHVSYYVATAYVPYAGCFQAAEPAKAGPDSAKMRAQFCEQPAVRYSHDGIETLIFDLRGSDSR